MGGELVTVEDEWGTPVDAAKLQDALTQNPDAKIVAFVHAETYGGVLMLKTLCYGRSGWMSIHCRLGHWFGRGRIAR